MVMRKYEKLFGKLKPIEPPANLFNRIILAIKREKEWQKKKRLLFAFFSLLIISFVTMPFSWTVLVEEVRSSGILYFISTAVSDFGLFLLLWQDFALAILESLPIGAILVFTANMALLLFTIFLFLHTKRLLIAYLIHK